MEGCFGLIRPRELLSSTKSSASADKPSRQTIQKGFYCSVLRPDNQWGPALYGEENASPLLGAPFLYSISRKRKCRDSPRVIANTAEKLEKSASKLMPRWKMTSVCWNNGEFLTSDKDTKLCFVTRQVKCRHLYCLSFHEKTLKAKSIALGHVKLVDQSS